MRGKVPQFYFSQIVYRITPAYAGKRRRVRGQCRRQQDHPRLCGEKLSLARISLARQGSPPPMRGKGVKQYTADRVVGITPAYAGKSSPAAVKVIFGQDHPRLCGEKIQNWLACWQEVGSPPPMRGKAIPAQPIIILIRITPAYAGKSHSVPAFSKVLRDHPRLCGEKLFLS